MDNSGIIDWTEFVAAECDTLPPIGNTKRGKMDDLQLRRRKTVSSRQKPKRTKSQMAPKRFSDLSGPELREKLYLWEVTQEQFAWITGEAGSTIRTWCAYKEPGKIPKVVDLIFELFESRPTVALRYKGSRGPRPEHMQKEAADTNGGLEESDR